MIDDSTVNAAADNNVRPRPSDIWPSVKALCKMNFGDALILNFER